MALKCKILQFAASPLFNDNQGFAGGSSEAERQLLVWYGGYRSDLWTRCLEACREFFNALNSNGFYELNQATGATPTQADYRYAYRMGYIELIVLKCYTLFVYMDTIHLVRDLLLAFVE